MPDLASPSVLVFAVPAVLAVLLWGLSLTGLLGDAGDGDGADSLLGAVPLSVVASVALFAFGWAGLALHLGAGLGLAWSAVGAALAAAALAVASTRALAPLFRSAPAPRGQALVGHVGVVSSEEVGPDFGTATVRLDGARLDVPVRLLDTPTADPAADPAADRPRYGTRVLLYDFDAARGVYLAAAHTDDA